MEIHATDVMVCDSGLKTHKRIEVCENGLFTTSKIEGRKQRNIVILVAGNMCIIEDLEAKEVTNVITAPFEIVFEKGV